VVPHAQWRTRIVDAEYGPPHLLPIGHDAGGNELYLSLGQDDHGYVYFGDHEENGDNSEYPDMEQLYLVTPSFDAFLAKLRERVEP